MKTYRLYRDEDKKLTCGDLGISVAEWFELLKSKQVKQYVDVLLCFLRELHQQSSCSALSGLYGKPSQYFNSKIINFSKWVTKELHRFVILDDKDDARYWPVPMIKGWEEKDWFIWQLRPELTEALRMYLMEDLIDQYREGCKSEIFCGSDELYKWKLIERNVNADIQGIIESLYGQNVIDNSRVDPVFKFLLANRREEVIGCVENLLDETKDLKLRLKEYKERMQALCANHFKVYANDERTAASLLTCKTPTAYTIYKDEVYRNICNYLGIETKKSGEKYIHFMNIVRKIADRYGPDLHTINEEALSNCTVNSDLLEVQNLFWCMRNIMKDIMKDKDDMDFSWLPYYREFADKLLAYRSDRKGLLDKIYAHRDDMLIDYLHDQGGRDDLFTDIDPFTVFGIFNRKETKANRIAAVQVFKDILDLKSDLPTDFTGIPDLHPQMSHFFGFKNRRGKDDIENLWELFECVLTGKPIKDIYNRVITQYIIQKNITMGLFWIRPEEFLALDKNNVLYLKDKYGITFPTKTPDYETYDGILTEVKDRMNSGTIKEKTFYELSANAFAYNNNDEDLELSYFDDVVETWKKYKNIVLYGAPGMGKTYEIPEYVVRLCEPDKDWNSASRDEIVEEYNLLKTQGRVRFTTFHQSMDYEEWIEGLQPEVTEDNQVVYNYKDGIFKKICNDAETPLVKDNKSGINGNATIWKVSLKGTGDNEVRTDCMKNDYIRIGWDDYGASIDDSTDWTKYNGEGRGILDTFINKMNVGDIVMSCYSYMTVDAIGVVTGEYEWHDELPDHKRVRKVKWLVKGIDENIYVLNDNKRMMQSTVYRLNSMTLDKVKTILEKYIHKETMVENTLPYIMVIDELNRGNVSKIFGETITLLEPSKRKGNKENAENVILPYSQTSFQVPDNVYVIATMNTADRSLATLDYAIRRRFAFIPCLPYEPEVDDDKEFEKELYKQVSSLFVKNYQEYLDSGLYQTFRFDPAETLSEGVDPRDVWIGYSYFIHKKGETMEDNLLYTIIPLLQEYIRDGILTPEAQDFVDGLYDNFEE